MNRVQRARQIWQVLIAAAHNRQILTYKLLSRLIYGKDAAGTLAQDLGIIMRYCKDSGLPPLTVLVVNEATGQPGDGLESVTVESLHRERERVYQKNWFELAPINDEDLKSSIEP